jgi:hypothetical protein
MGRTRTTSFCSRPRGLPLRRPIHREDIAVPAAKKHTIEEEVVFLAIRIPKSMKRELQQAALDEESSVQALVRSAIQSELGRRASRPARARRR